MGPLRIEVGRRVELDGEAWRVVRLGTGHVVLLSAAGKMVAFAWEELSRAHLAPVAGDTEEASSAEPFGLEVAELVGAQALRRARQIEAAVQELESGSRPGDLAGPRPEMALDRPLVSREKLLANELGVGVSTLRRYRSRYRDHGLYGLVDHRQVPSSVPLARLDPRIKEAILAVAAAEADASTGSRVRLGRRVEAYLAAKHGANAVPLPPRSTFYRALGILLEGRHTFGVATTRRNAARVRSAASQPVVPTRVGEYVLFDSTLLDVLAHDPATGRAVAVELTVAVDLATRLVLASRVTPRGARAVETTQMLADMLEVPSRPDAASGRLHPASLGGIELRRVLGLVDSQPIPPVWPETVVLDHGKVFAESVVFRDACRELKISVSPARVLTPTDKAHVESFFRAVREQFSQWLPGFKGNSVANRGRDPGQEARWTVEELDDLFDYWRAAVWPQRPHEGLRVLGRPHPLTPMEAYDVAVALAGVVVMLPDDQLRIRLLPVEWRRVQRYGVDIDGLVYNGSALDSVRGQRSAYSLHGGKWPIRVDPRDRSRAWFRGSEDERFAELRWIHAPDPCMPFSDGRWAELRKRFASEGRVGLDKARRALQEIVDAGPGRDAPPEQTKRGSPNSAREARARRDIPPARQTGPGRPRRKDNEHKDQAVLPLEPFSIAGPSSP